MKNRTGGAAERAHGFGRIILRCSRKLDGMVGLEGVLGVGLRRVMRELGEESGLRPTELAKRVDVTKQAVGQALRELEANGWVKCVQDPQDGRSVQIKLTPSGASEVREAEKRMGVLEKELELRVGEKRMESARRVLVELQLLLEEKKGKVSAVQKVRKVRTAKRKR